MYDKKKDTNPTKTVNVIKSILNNLGFKLEEDYLVRQKITKNTPHSIRIHAVGDKGLGVNGKGTSYEYSLASAYAEFLERLQNGALLAFPNEEFTVAPDEIKINYSQLLENKNGYANSLLTDFSPDEFSAQKSLKDLYYLSLLRYKHLYGNITDLENVITVPYYSVREKKIVYIPQTLVMLTQTSNGMCSGNTPNEAIVQGLSEVTERYSLYNIIYNNVILPNVPQEAYTKYHELVKIIDHIESFGYKVTVKDASLNKKLPVICTTFEHTEKGVYLISIGSHPSLPIAIERTLTEFLQGFDISNPDNLEQFHNYNEYEKSAPEEFFRMRDASVSYRMAVVKPDFFFAEPSYSFDDKTWAIDSDITNKSMMQKMINLCLGISQDIYIRDVSFLGFPSYQIVIPRVATLAKYDERILSDAIDFFEWKEIIRGNKNIISDKESLLKGLIYNMKFLSTQPIIPVIKDEYIAIIISMNLKKYEMTFYYIEKLLSQNKLIEEEKLILLCLKQYLILMSKNLDTEQLRYELEKSTSKMIVDSMINIFINNDPFLSISKLLDFIKNNAMPSAFVKKDTKIDIKRLESIQKKIREIYKKNVIDQNEIGNLMEVLDNFSEQDVLIASSVIKNSSY